MSYTELHKGKLVPVKYNLSTGQFLEWLVSNEGFYVEDLGDKIDDGYDTLEVFNTEDVLAYLYTKNVLYQVTDYSGGEYCSDEINLTIKQPDGSIDFMYLFYNGGTCFSEMLEEGLESIKEKTSQESPEEFLRRKLSILASDFEGLTVKYQKDINTGLHKVSTTPFSFYDDEEYLERESIIEKMFEERYPYERLLFLGECSLYEIEKPF